MIKLHADEYTIFAIHSFKLIVINILSNIVERGDYLAKVTCGDKEQIVLVENVSNNQCSVTQNVRIDSDIMSKSIPVRDACCTVDNNCAQSSTSSTVDGTALEELIEEVRKRPPIYDYTLPLSVRGRQQIADLWTEISEALNGSLLLYKSQV